MEEREEAGRYPECLVRLKTHYHGLRASEQRVADYIIERPSEVVTLSVTELAARAEVSITTIVRLCQAIGYKGYQEFKFSLERDLLGPLPNIRGEINPEDDLITVKYKIFETNRQAIADTLAILSDEELKRAVDAIAAARLIAIYGQGGANSVAQDLYHKFLNIGRWACVAHTDGNLQMMCSSLLGKKDVAIGISHSGEMKDIVDALTIAKHGGATTIAITGRPRSPLAEVADIRLFTASSDTIFRNDYTSARIAELTVIDVLYVGVALRNYEESLENANKTREATSIKRCVRSRVNVYGNNSE